MRLRIHRRSEVGAADGCVPGSVSTQPRAERGERAERELHGASARGRRSDGKTKARFIGPGRPGLASTGPRNKYLYACVRACVLFLQSRCRSLAVACPLHLPAMAARPVTAVSSSTRPRLPARAAPNASGTSSSLGTSVSAGRRLLASRVIILITPPLPFFSPFSGGS
jgi:hypothetical protein